MKDLLFRVNLISVSVVIVLLTNSVGYAKATSALSLVSNCGEWIIESASLSQDRRLGADLTQQVTGDDCYGIVTLKNQTGIPFVSSYTLALTSSSSNANVQFVPDPVLVPGLNIDVKITPTDLSKVASVTLQSGVTIGSASLDASLWLIKSLIDLAPLPTGCIVSNDQLLLLGLRKAPILENSVRLAFEGNLVAAQLEFKRVLPEYGKKATELLLKDIPLGCAADGLKAILKKPFVLFKIGFAYGAWLATVFFDYFEYQGLSVGPAVILSYVPPTPPASEPVLDDVIVYVSVDSFGNEIDLKLVKPDGSNLRTLPLDDAASAKYKPLCWPPPTFSPNGKYLAVARSTLDMSSEELIVIDVETGEKISNFNNFGRSYDWSPDSSQILHGRDLQWDAGGSTKAEGLWTTNILSGQNQLLVPPDSGLPLSYPKWSPDGSHIAFHEIVYPEGFGPFAVAASDGTDYRGWKRQVGFFDWSPDGQEIVFDNLVYSYEDPGLGLFISDSTGANERVLLDNDQLIGIDPHWSPDGQYIAFINVKSLPASLWVIKPDRSGSRQLSNASLGGISAVSWSPESKRIVVSSDQGINILSLNGDPPVSIGQGSCPDWQK